MKLYCMCQITGDIPVQGIDSQGFGPIDGQVFLAPNRFGLAGFDGTDDKASRPVVLFSSMECVKNGVEQRVPDSSVVKGIPNPWPQDAITHGADLEKLRNTRRHFPDVGMYQCQRCGAIICVEG